MFDEFWKVYPARHGRKVGKAICQVVFDKCPASDQLLIVQAAQQYAKACHAKDEQFVPLPRDPIRFLKQDWWREWVERPDVQAAKPIITPSRPAVQGVSMREALADWPEGLAKLERILQHGPALSVPSRSKSTASG